MEPSKKPLNVLIRQMNAYISITLKNGMEYRGTMVHCDGYMNIILEGASEHYNGQLLAHYGQVLVRGNNILFISLNVTPQKRENLKPATNSSGSNQQTKRLNEKNSST